MRMHGLAELRNLTALFACVVTQPPSCSVEPEGMKMYGVWVYPMGILVHFIFFKTAGDER